jgi:hypothetical protein
LKVPLRFCIILLLLAGLSGIHTPAIGQSSSVVIFSSPEIDQFPAVRFHLDVMDAEGNFVSNLQPADIQVIENGTPLTPQSVEMVENGLQLIIAINPSPALSVQANGISEYMRQIQAIREWASVQPAQSPDDFSLSTPTGLFLIRARDPKKFEQALGEFSPDLAKTQPSLNSLSEALDLATDPLGRPLMKRSILYITTALPPANTASLPDLAKRAQEIGVRINVWLVGPAESTGAAADTLDPLQQLAESTGGKYFRVLPGTPLPEIEPAFQALRHTYAIQYQSAIKQSGSHSLSVKVKIHSTDTQSAEMHFDLDVQPPNPMFLDPPNQVHRTWTPATKNVEAANLDPDSIPLSIMIEFPDTHPRALKATRLYADGKLVGENTAEPFDRFDWSITSLETPGRSLLRVEAVDALDITGTSVEVPIDVLVDQPVKTSLFDRLSERGLIAITAMIVAGAALALILAFTSTQRRARWKRQQADKILAKDPVTQPVLVQPVAPRQSRTGFWKKRENDPRAVPFWPRPSTPNAPARLIALDDTEQPVTGGIIFLARQEITFGSDPKRATQVLNSPTVDGLHARLYRTPDDDFFLADQNSIAGTWINYAPVTAIGAHLEHGDIIHIGKVMFRFELTDPSQVPPLEVKVVNLEQPHDPQ